MKRFYSRVPLYLPVKINDIWRSCKFEESLNKFFYDPKNEEEEKQLMANPDCVNGKIWYEEKEPVVQRQEPVTELGKQRKATNEAKKANKEVVDGVASCSDARAFLRERYPDEDVLLRSKKDITEYAASKNIFFSEL